MLQKQFFIYESERAEAATRRGASPFLAQCRYRCCSDQRSHVSSVDITKIDSDTVTIDQSSHGSSDVVAVLRQRGAAIELTGQDVSSWLFKVSGGAIKEEIREETTPPDDADVERALVLASRK